MCWGDVVHFWRTNVITSDIDSQGWITSILRALWKTNLNDPQVLVFMPLYSTFLHWKGLTLKPTEYDRCNRLLTPGHKRHCNFFPAFLDYLLALGKVSCHVTRPLKEPWRGLLPTAIWMSHVEADPLAPVKTSNDLSPGQHLDCNLTRDLRSESPSQATSQRPDLQSPNEIIYVYCLF